MNRPPWTRCAVSVSRKSHNCTGGGGVCSPSARTARCVLSWEAGRSVHLLKVAHASHAARAAGTGHGQVHTRGRSTRRKDHGGDGVTPAATMSEQDYDSQQATQPSTQGKYFGLSSLLYWGRASHSAHAVASTPAANWSASLGTFLPPGVEMLYPSHDTREQDSLFCRRSVCRSVGGPPCPLRARRGG